MSAREQALALLASAERRLAAQRENRWCPHKPTPKQREFLSLTADDALFGGAAGGGKSDALLMDALRGVDVPGYAALVVRKTYRDLALPGAIMDRAAEWLRPTAAHWSDMDKTWTFPSGARLTFGYLDTEADKYRYQSAEFQTLCVDELTQFEEAPVRYLRSRLRRKRGFPVEPHSRNASNPGGVGHKWVYDRYVAVDAPFPFVPALIMDNPHVDQEDYLARLEDLDETTRAQLRDGMWVQDTEGLIYPITAANIVPQPPEVPGRFHHMLGVDLGTREDKPTTAFAVVGWSPKIDGVWCFEGYKKAGLTPHTTGEEIDALMQRYGGFAQIVVDHGGLGDGYIKDFRMRWAIPAQKAEKQSKLGFRKLLRGALERQRLMFVGPMCADLLAEASELRWDEKYPGEKEPKGADNHCTDALLYSWRACKAFAARAPEPRPTPGTPEAYAAEMEALEAEEDRRGLRQKRTRERSKWWQR